MENPPISQWGITRIIQLGSLLKSSVRQHVLICAYIYILYIYIIYIYNPTYNIYIYINIHVYFIYIEPAIFVGTSQCLAQVESEKPMPKAQPKPPRKALKAMMPLPNLSPKASWIFLGQGRGDGMNIWDSMPSSSHF